VLTAKIRSDIINMSSVIHVDTENALVLKQRGSQKKKSSAKGGDYGREWNGEGRGKEGGMEEKPKMQHIWHYGGHWGRIWGAAAACHIFRKLFSRATFPSLIA